MIEFQWENGVPSKEVEAELTRVAEACAEEEGIGKAGFTVLIVDDEQIRDFNRRMRGVDAATDVLSFPAVQYPKGKTARDVPHRLQKEYDPVLGCINLGDCVLNIDRARQQAAEYGHSVKRELCYLTAHSAFHLMGYDHMTDEDKRVMRAMEEKVLGKLGLTREEACDLDYDALFRKACEAIQNAYAPYSHFRVGACILTDSGRTFTGCNFENASYGATICAERCAASCAVAAGERRFVAIAIAAEKEAAWPCGICRQVLREFSAPSLPVIIGKAGEGYQIKALGELLPNSFGPEDLLNG